MSRVGQLKKRQSNRKIRHSPVPRKYSPNSQFNIIVRKKPRLPNYMPTLIKRRSQPLPKPPNTLLKLPRTPGLPIRPIPRNRLPPNKPNIQDIITHMPIIPTNPITGETQLRQRNRRLPSPAPTRRISPDPIELNPHQQLTSFLPPFSKGKKTTPSSGGYDI